MKPFSDSAATQPTPDRAHRTLAARTYGQMAQILSQRSGTAVTQAQAARLCRAAEAKLANALLTDPVVRQIMQAGTAMN
jgi:hypothetical protein